MSLTGIEIAELIATKTKLDTCPRWERKRVFKKPYEDIIRYMLQRHQHAQCPAEFYLTKLYLTKDLPTDELNSVFDVKQRWNIGTHTEKQKTGRVIIPTPKITGNTGRFWHGFSQSYHIVGGV